MDSETIEKAKKDVKPSPKLQRLFLRLKHCNGENENECKNFHDVAG